jgi:hypothetical protein
MMGLGSNSYFVTITPFMNGGHNYGITRNVGYLKLDLVGLLVNDGMLTMSMSPMLYYRSFGTTSIPLGSG